MTELAKKIIAENIAKYQRGEDAAYLDLGKCGLYTLPDLSALSWLETLIVSNEWWDWEKRRWIGSANRGEDNFLKDVPSFALPVSLKILILGGGYGKKWTLPNLEFLCDLTQLHTLDLSSNKINDWFFLHNLTQLQILDLRSNQISNADFLSNLIHLHTLNLSSNKISDVNFVSTLRHLQSLDLHSNLIQNGDFLCDLTQLHTLDLSHNKISAWNFLSNLTKLQNLYLQANSITDGGFLCNLTQLQNLDLRLNNISDGSFLGNLTNLHTLDLRNNQVNNLKPIVHLIEKGVQVTLNNHHNQGINFYNNPLTTPPVEIVNQGNAAILRYFEELKKSGYDQIYEAKLLLIGEGRAGKTSLRFKLFNPVAVLPKEEDYTRGIDIQALHFNVHGLEDKLFRLNIWDFAGQGIYQSAHSFFYTHRSLYVFVDDTSTLNENGAYLTLYNNWLQTAELFGGNSPVVVLHNEKGDYTRTGFNLGSFTTHFKFVHGELFRINLGGKEISKIEDLKNQIQRLAFQLPHVGNNVPRPWVKVRNALEKERKKKPYISVERYWKLCERAGITDQDMQKELSQYFHDIGVFLHFQNHPLLKRDVFLQNQWVTDAVYKILDDPEIAKKQRGRFTRDDLVWLWQEDSYQNRHDELLALMLQFELCYQVQDSKTYICPQLLPGDIPRYDLGKDIPLQMKYDYEFMPKGLLYRLIVRLHRHIAQAQTAVWNSGFLLQREGSQAEIIESLDRRTITIKSTGLHAKELINIVHGHIEDLHASFGDRLKVQVKVPCNCDMCSETNTPYFYNKKELETRLAKGKATVECNESYNNVNVQELLDGVFVKEISSRNGAKNQLVISYFKSDKTYLEAFKKHLATLIRRNSVETWDNTNLEAGQDWDATIRKKLSTANIIVFLVSADLIQDEYNWNVEMKEALKRHKQGTATIIPVIVRKCNWEDTPLGQFAALPDKDNPVSAWSNEDEAWTQVVAKIEAVLTERRLA